jgi:hypothetical protein
MWSSCTSLGTCVGSIRWGEGPASWCMGSIGWGGGPASWNANPFGASAWSFGAPPIPAPSEAQLHFILLVVCSLVLSASIHVATKPVHSIHVGVMLSCLTVWKCRSNQMLNCRLMYPLWRLSMRTTFQL